MCPRQLIRNDAPLERDADALVGILLEGGSMPWPKAIRSLVDGAGDGLDHLGELRAEGAVRLDGARDQLKLEMVASNQRVVLAVLAASGDVGGVTRMAVLVNVGGRGRMGDDDVEEGGECLSSWCFRD